MSECSGVRRRRKLGRRGAEKIPSNEVFLPDDVVMNILSRLPAKDVLGYRCVCRGWRDLTSTKDFTDLHFRHSFPMILMDYKYSRLAKIEKQNGLILLDGCWEPARTRSMIYKLYGPDRQGVVLSQNGLIVVVGRCLRCLFSELSVFVIYNPIYRDVVKIRLQQYTYIDIRICGVFFHPIQKEYCILWETILSFEPCKVKYRILNLESDPKWRDICTQNVRIWDFEPVFIDKYLYWIVMPSQLIDDLTFNCEIMEYDIIKEEFRLILFPIRVKHENINLVDSDGVLSLIHVFPSNESVEINIWTLNDDKEPLWSSCNYVVSNDVYSGYRVPKAIAFWNGELVLNSNGRLYVCNLEFGTFRKFGRSYKYDVKFLPHVSLKNCKSDIFMAYENKINQP